MCVAIAMEPNTELTEEEVFRMGRANADGIGVAWAEDGQVHWYKSINYTPEGAYKFIKERAGFFRLVHFRLSTVGGVRVDLCHPFEVGPMANPGQQGHSAKVLIHNGHWYRWKDLIELFEKEDALPDKGPWSDSRLAAYLASMDEDWLDVVTGRVAVMDGEGTIKLLGQWETLRPGIKVSNKIWDHGFNYRRSGRDRDWPGWGQTAEYWMEREKHEKALEEAREAKEKAEKEEKEKKEKEARESKESSKEEGKEKRAEGSKRTTATEAFTKYTHGALVRTDKGEHAEASVCVGGGPGHSGAVQHSHRGGGKSGPGSELGGAGDAGSTGVRRTYVAVGTVGLGERSPLYIYKDGKEIIETEGEFVADGKVRVSVEEKQGRKEISYDHTPWQNGKTGKWYWIPPTSVVGTKYRIETLDERNARAILESIATPLHSSDRE